MKEMTSLDNRLISAIQNETKEEDFPVNKETMDQPNGAFVEAEDAFSDYSGQYKDFASTLSHKGVLNSDSNFALPSPKQLVSADYLTPNSMVVLQNSDESEQHLHSNQPSFALALPSEQYLPLEETAPLSGGTDLKGSNSLQGVCGLYNLGNTCFMNSVIQCLISTHAFREIFSTTLSDTNIEINQEFMMSSKDTSKDIVEPSVGLIEAMREIFQKISSGEYLSLYPVQLHSAVAKVSPIFGDYKQHDGQEFLAFILDAVHNRFNAAHSDNNRHESSNESHPSLSAANGRDESENAEDCCKRLRIDDSADSVVNSVAKRGTVHEMSNIESTSKQAWEQYTKNQSVIVNKFQGQFKSTVTCCKCSFVSTTYEPFMFLSLPIPHAMEMQIIVTWVPSYCSLVFKGGISVRRYLVTVNKNGSVKELREAFLALIQLTDSSLCANRFVLAEVEHSCNLRIFDDRTPLKYVSKKKDVYAMEMIQVDDDYPNREFIINDIDLIKTDNTDNVDLDICNGVTKSNKLEQLTNESFDATEGRTEGSEVSEGGSFDMIGAKGEGNCSSASAWHSCCICLEDMFDESLSIHPACGGMMCHDCLKNTAQFHSNSTFPCPVCNRFIQPEDFKPLVNVASSKPTIRQVLIPFLLRKETPQGLKMFGHPTVACIQSELSSDLLLNLGREIHSHILQDKKVSVVLTDSSGLSCINCDVFARCTGCPVKEGEVVKLKPGCCVTVNPCTKTGNLEKQAGLCIDDTSMQHIRNTDVVMLDECLQKFAELEVLGEDNPWFCPQCKSNQISTKLMTVSQLPEVLIIHMKRFYFEGTVSAKVTNPVHFSLFDLDVSNVIDDELKRPNSSKPASCYDLYGCVCHTGTLSGGHYTAYTKSNPSNEWYFFNDESYEKKIPQDDEAFSQAYILFLQRNTVAKTK